MTEASPAPIDPLSPVTVTGASLTDPRTGEPRRPWLVWAASMLFLAGVAVIAVALLLALWTSVDRFAEAAWLNHVVPTELGDPLRVLLVLGVWASALVIGIAASITGYYAWAGYRWTRWAGLISVALGGLSFLMNSLAPWCLVPLALGAALLWMPPVRRFFGQWQATRHQAPPEPGVADSVFYGPLPRYR